MQTEKIYRLNAVEDGMYFSEDSLIEFIKEGRKRISFNFFADHDPIDIDDLGTLSFFIEDGENNTDPFVTFSLTLDEAEFMAEAMLSHVKLTRKEVELKINR